MYLLLADAWCEMGQEFENAKEALATVRQLCKEGSEQLTSRYDELDKLQRDTRKKSLSVCVFVYTCSHELHVILLYASGPCV